MGADFREIVTHPTYSLPFLQAGRLVKVRHGKLDFGWGVIVNYQKRSPPKVSWIQTDSLIFKLSFEDEIKIKINCKDKKLALNEILDLYTKYSTIKRDLSISNIDLDCLITHNNLLDNKNITIEKLMRNPKLSSNNKVLTKQVGLLSLHII